MSTSDVTTSWTAIEPEGVVDHDAMRVDERSRRDVAGRGHHDTENAQGGWGDQLVLSGDDIVNVDDASSRTMAGNTAEAAPDVIIDVADSVMARLADRGVSPRGAGAGFDASSVELHSLIIAAVDEADRVRVRQGQAPLSSDVREHVESAAMAEIIGTGPLDPYFSDPDVEEIDVNSAGCTWVTWCDGRKVDVGRLWPDDEALTQFQKRLARRMSATGEGRLDTASPTLTLQTRAGDRVVMVLGGESEHGLSPPPRLSIRRYVIRRTGLSGLVERGLMVPAAADFLSAAVRAGCTILISGPPGAGKTTLLTELLGEVDPDERIITVEKHLLELGLEVGGRHRDSVALHTRGANAEGLGEVGTRQLVELTRRLNPDRVVIGELVEDEALDMLDVASMCSRGSLATIHAHTAEAVIHRLAYYVAKAQTSLPEFAVWNLIAHTVDLVVHVDAITPRDSLRRRSLVPARRVTSVIEIGPVGERGVPTLSDVLVWDAAHDALRAKSPLSSRLIDRIRSHSAASSSPQRRSSGEGGGR